MSWQERIREVLSTNQQVASQREAEMRRMIEEESKRNQEIERLKEVRNARRQEDLKRILDGLSARRLLGEIRNQVWGAGDVIESPLNSILVLNLRPDSL